MTAPVIIKGGWDGLDVETCPNLTEEFLNDLFKHWPLSTMPISVQDKLIKTVIPAIDIHTFSTGKGRIKPHIAGYYSPKHKHIVMNLSMYKYVFSGCNVIKKPDTIYIEKIANTLAHELIHLICLEKYNSTLMKIYSKYGPWFYSNFWWNILGRANDKDKYVHKLGKLHYQFVLNEQLNNARGDKLFGVYGQIYNYKYKRSEEKLRRLINILKQHEWSKTVQNNLSEFEKGFDYSSNSDNPIWFSSNVRYAIGSAYKIFCMSEKEYMLHVFLDQEIFVLSEVFCVLTDVKCDKAKEIVETILKQY